jgi:hypothetical protein
MCCKHLETASEVESIRLAYALYDHHITAKLSEGVILKSLAAITESINTPQFPLSTTVIPPIIQRVHFDRIEPVFFFSIYVSH